MSGRLWRAAYYRLTDGAERLERSNSQVPRQRDGARNDDSWPSQASYCRSPEARVERTTALYDSHIAMHARMVPFAGWSMPLNYGSQLEEHHAVRTAAGMFDVSHMQILDLFGMNSQRFLRRLLANDVAKLQQPGRALYSCMLNENGGVIDDLIVYFLDPAWYRLVVNATTASTDLAWIMAHASEFELEVRPRPDLAMIAVQGPDAIDHTLSLLSENIRTLAATLTPFSAVYDANWFIARTGYTGEDGFEVILPNNEAPIFWKRLAASEVCPCGLGARDTLRLEAGMNLYGDDMNQETSPLEAGLKWTVAFEPSERDFVGRAALEAQLERGGLRCFVGLLLEGRGVLRNHLPLFAGEHRIGEITSGGYSPTLSRSIALARIEPVPEPIEVEIRGKRELVRLVDTPFVRDGKPLIEL